MNDKPFTLVRTTSSPTEFTLETEYDSVADAVACHQYTLTSGKLLQKQPGAKKINLNPRTPKSLVDNLNKALFNKKGFNVITSYSIK